MYSFLKFLFTLVLISSFIFAQNNYTIMSYNLLNYPGSDTTTRNPYFRIVLSSIQPDILVVQEITSQSGVDGFLNNVLKAGSSKSYTSGTFINGYDTDNAIFYDSSLFTFISNNPIATALRDISEFVLKSKVTSDTIRTYSVHLKAGSTASDQTLRAAEVDSLRKVTDNLPPNSNYIVCGDYNMQSSYELAFLKLLSQTNPGYFVDPLNLVGVWYNNASFIPYHTQSTRTRSFGGGATGGMDDRFDMILMSQAIIDNGDITYIPGTYTAYGNDASHFNDSINSPPNTAVGQTIANALHHSSDHLPVFASFSFESHEKSITLLLTALIQGFYNGISMIPDTVNVILHQSAPPYSAVDSCKIFLDDTGNGIGKFNNAPSGTYYIAIKHRNSIETWSREGGEQFTRGETLNYDFTTGPDKAYGGNLTPK